MSPGGDDSITADTGVVGGSPSQSIVRQMTAGSVNVDMAARDSGVESWNNQNSPSGRTSPADSHMPRSVQQQPVSRDVAAALAVHLELCHRQLQVSEN